MTSACFRKDSICGVSELRKKYETWCEENDERPLNVRNFNDRLTVLNCRKDRQPYDGKRTRVWVGIGILEG